MLSSGNYKTSITSIEFLYLSVARSHSAETLSSREKTLGLKEGESKGQESLAAVVDMLKCI